MAMIAVAMLPLLLLLTFGGTLGQLGLILRVCLQLLLILGLVCLTQAFQWSNRARFSWLWLLDYRSVVSLGHRLAIYQLPQGNLSISTRREEPAYVCASGAQDFLRKLKLQQRVNHICMVLKHSGSNFSLDIMNLDV